MSATVHDEEGAPADKPAPPVRDERVFCLKRSDLQEVLARRQGSVTISELLALPQYFLARSIAEHDPGYKQLIPYQLFCREDAFFVYQRGGGVGESRLAGRLSLGIGGHINSADAPDGILTPRSYLAALQREQEEELVGLPPCEANFLGLIDDDRDPVGLVHLGAVHLATLPPQAAPDIRQAGEDLRHLGWWTAAEIDEQRQRFESWSLLALDLTQRHHLSP